MPSLPKGPRRAATAAALLLAPVACRLERAAGPENAAVPRRALTAPETQAVRAANDFAFGLLREVGAEREHRGRNLVLSPYSGAAALGMTLNGAAGATRTGMQQALGLAGQSVEQGNATFKGLTGYLLGADPAVTVRTANSVWAAEGFTVRPAFAEAVRTYYDAEARTARFGTAEATRAINAWASEKTAGRIPKVFDDGEPSGGTVMLLMNALYFKGTWAARFDPARTRPAPFRLDDGAVVSVPTMSREETALRVGFADGARVGELAYGNGAYAMTIVLPPAGTGVEAYAAALTPARWDALVGSLRDATLPVTLPKFALKGKSEWNAPLARLGMADAFDPRRADFSGLSERCLPQGPAGRDCHISFVQQHIDLQVDEEGTVAAAVTSVGIRVTSAPVPFAVDRSFLFAIRERASGAILFVGRIVDPSAG
jgi:serpin B